jgi:hypothetical protein
MSKSNVPFSPVLYPEFLGPHIPPHLRDSVLRIKLTQSTTVSKQDTSYNSQKLTRYQTSDVWHFKSQHIHNHAQNMHNPRFINPKLTFSPSKRYFQISSNLRVSSECGNTDKVVQLYRSHIISSCASQAQARIEVSVSHTTRS